MRCLLLHTLCTCGQLWTLLFCILLSVGMNQTTTTTAAVTTNAAAGHRLIFVSYPLFFHIINKILCRNTCSVEGLYMTCKTMHGGSLGCVWPRGMNYVRMGINTRCDMVSRFQRYNGCTWCVRLGRVTCHMSCDTCSDALSMFHRHDRSMRSMGLRWVT